MTDITQPKQFKDLLHDPLIDLTRAFAPTIPEDGVCNGFTSMWLQAVLTSKEDEALFYQRLDSFSLYLEKNSVMDLKNEIDGIYSARAKSIIKSDFTDEVLQKLEFRAFAEAIALQQKPQIISKKHISQINKQVLYPLTASKKIEEQKIKFHIETIGVLIPTLEELEKYFEEIKTVLITLNQGETIGFMLSSNNHSIGVYLDRASEKFHCLDINQLENKKTYYAEVDPEEFTALLFESFFTDNSVEQYSPFDIIAISTAKCLLLIEQLKNITQKTLLSTASENRKNSTHVTALQLACLNAHTEIVTLLLNDGTMKGINAPNKNGNTPFIVACQEGHIGIVKLLLQNSAFNSMNTPNKNGVTPFYLACQEGHIGIVKLLLKKGTIESINTPNKNGSTPFSIACQEGHIGIVKLLLQNSAFNSMNTPNKNGSTPFFMACQEGHTAIVALLLKNDDLEENINTRNTFHGTPLYAACHNGHFEIVSLLLKLDVKESMNLTTNTDNTTPLFVACENGHTKIVALLLQNGAIDSVTTPDIEKNTPFSIAQKNNHTEIMTLLENFINPTPAAPMLFLSNPNKRKAEDGLEGPPEKKIKLNEEKMNENNLSWPCLIM